ncbi:MAG TPA: segregation/condensation protein A, partial [Actinobacteria bacterium]|nr:segregation/condensation protein A [Actinomycetes bacterium]HEX21176.1 segregation/condensation protein A [Actinomycetota bacterium]
MVISSRLPYEVKLEVFEGPFDLLLSLISKHKLDIYDIPISEIANEYLRYIENMRELDLEIASEFLLLAATLLEIKSAALLPREKRSEPVDDLTADEKQQLLISRLVEYKKFKNVARSLSSRLNAQERYYMRIAGIEPRFSNLLPDFLDGIKLARLRDIYQDLINNNTIRLIDSSHIGAIRIGVGAKIEEILELLRSRPKQYFRDLTAGAADRDEVIATFLALLELYKRGRIAINQAITFGEIEIM